MNAQTKYNGERGFTATDLLVGFAIGAILLGVAIPQYRSLTRSIGQTGAVNQVEFAIRRAKAEAVARGVRGVIEIDMGTGMLTTGLDLLPFSEPPAVEEVVVLGQLPPDTSIEADNNRLVFDSRGFLIDDAGDPIEGSIDFFHSGERYATGTVFATGVFLIRVRD